MSADKPYTKPQPVVIYGAGIAALTTLVSGLTVLFKDDPTAILWLGVIGVVVSAMSVFKDQIVKSQVVPLSDTAAYINKDAKLIAGPASPLEEGAGAEVVPAGSGIALPDDK